MAYYSPSAYRDLRAKMRIPTVLAQTQGIPEFTIRQEMTSETATGRKSQGDQRVVSRSADGSRVEWYRSVHSNGAVSESWRIVNSAKLEIHANDSVQLVSTFKLSDPQYLARLDGRPDPAKDCLAFREATERYPKQYLGREVIQGVEAIKVLKRVNQIEVTSWLAPSLGCEELQSESRSPDGNGIFISRLVTTKVEQTSDARLFKIPEQYREVAPSVRLKASSALIDCPNNDSAGVAALDRAYFRHRP
jgi:hypothetical protein